MPVLLTGLPWEVNADKVCVRSMGLKRNLSRAQINQAGSAGVEVRVTAGLGTTGCPGNYKSLWLLGLVQIERFDSRLGLIYLLSLQMYLLSLGVWQGEEVKTSTPSPKRVYHRVNSSLCISLQRRDLFIFLPGHAYRLSTWQQSNFIGMCGPGTSWDIC